MKTNGFFFATLNVKYSESRENQMKLDTPIKIDEKVSFTNELINSQS